MLGNNTINSIKLIDKNHLSYSLAFYFQWTLWSTLREPWWHCSTRWQTFGYREHVWKRGNSKASIHCVLCAWPWWHHCHTVDLVLDGRAWLLERVRPRLQGKLLFHLASGKATTFVWSLLAGQQVLRSFMCRNYNDTWTVSKLLKLNFI